MKSHNLSIKQSVLTLVLFIFSFSVLLAQDDFEGKIVYSISYSNLPPQMKNYESMLPKTISVNLKGNMSQVEQKQMMGASVVVSDMQAKTGFIEMEMGNQKLRMKVSNDQFEEDSNKLNNIEYIDESKTIAGYPCKKAIMKDEKGNPAITVFYTEKIKNQAQKEFAGLKGFPLQYQMTQQNMTMEMTATEITETSIDDAIFEKRDGYKDISKEDLQKMMMGGGQ